jgi:hypothetical protein
MGPKGDLFQVCFPFALFITFNGSFHLLRFTVGIPVPTKDIRGITVPYVIQELNEQGRKRLSSIVRSRQKRHTYVNKVYLID